MPRVLNQSVISTNFGYDRSVEGIDFMTSNVKNILLGNVQSIRSGGSAACEICSVACGRLDAFYECGIHPWDIAAGVLIVTEAQGVGIDPYGGPLDLLSRRVLVANSTIAQLMVNVLTKTPIISKWKSSS